MPGFYIDHLQGERAGATDHIDAEVARVGRNAEFELYFDEMGVSWEHAELRRRDGDWWVIDRGSTNGTYVNDERAHNARLRDGDILKFGKKGPVLRFRLATAAPSPSGRLPAVDPAPAATGAPTSRQPAVAPAGPTAAVPAVAGADDAPAPAPPPRPRSPTRRLPSEAEIAVPNPALLDARSDLPPAAPKPARGSAWPLALAASGAVLVLITSGVAATLFFEARDQDAALQAERARTASLERDLKAAEAGFAERLGALRRERDDLDLELRRVQAELDRTRRRADDDAARQAERVGQLERELAAARARRDRVPTTPAGPGASEAAGAAPWKAIERRNSPSVLLIAVRLEGRARDGSIVPLHGFGTGFFASAEGHIITNKHVVEPWKFRPLADRITAEGIEVIESSYQLFAWRNGERFVRPGTHELELSTGYSTVQGTLALVRTAPDRWITPSLPGDKGPRAVRVHDEQSNEDLALLKAKVAQPVTALPFASSDTLEKLDDVLVLGFPAGPGILEAGVAETSPAPGTVRKVEQTIFVSAAMIPGNSGGPLLDRRGRVVGICVRVVEGTETLGSCLRAEHAVTLLHGGPW